MYQIYQMMPGDDLETVANKFNTTKENIMAINGFSSVTMLMPGTYMVVPKMNDETYYTYTVQQGDNLYSIARRFGVTSDAIESLNGLKKNEYIYPTQELLIPTEGLSTYITEEETLEDISKKSGVSLSDLVEQNKSLYVLPDQVVIYKVEKN